MKKLLMLGGLVLILISIVFGTTVMAAPPVKTVSPVVLMETGGGERDIFKDNQTDEGYTVVTESYGTEVKHVSLTLGIQGAVDNNVAWVYLSGVGMRPIGNVWNQDASVVKTFEFNASGWQIRVIDGGNDSDFGVYWYYTVTYPQK